MPWVKLLLRLILNDNTFIGHSAWTDITYASALAHLDAVNKYMYTQKSKGF